MKTTTKSSMKEEHASASMKRRRSPSAALETKHAKIAKEIVDALAKLGILEMLYGYAGDQGCRIVAIADDLPSTQRDEIWQINLDFQQKYPDVDIDVRIIQRRGRELSEIYKDDGTALIIKETASV